MVVAGVRHNDALHALAIASRLQSRGDARFGNNIILAPDPRIAHPRRDHVYFAPPLAPSTNKRKPRSLRMMHRPRDSPGVYAVMRFVRE